MTALTPAEIAETLARVRDTGATSVKVRVSRGGTMELEAKWQDDEPPKRQPIRPRL